MADNPLHTPGSRIDSSRPGSGRSLSDPVLSSAEEELDMDTSTHDTGASYTDTGLSGSSVNGQSDRKPAWWMRMEDQLSRYVTEQPGRAALAALGAGALAALVLGRSMRGRRRKD